MVDSTINQIQNQQPLLFNGGSKQVKPKEPKQSFYIFIDTIPLVGECYFAAVILWRLARIQTIDGWTKTSDGRRWLYVLQLCFEFRDELLLGAQLIICDTEPMPNQARRRGIIISPTITKRAQLWRSLASLQLKRSWKRLLIDAYCFGFLSETFVEKQFRFFNLNPY